jgi:peptide/nickel transport system permease protein
MVAASSNASQGTDRDGTRHRAVATVRRFAVSRELVIGLCVFAVLGAFAVLGPFLSPYAPNATGDSIMAGPSGTHPFGTDEFGRDVMSRVMAGSRVSLFVGLMATAIAMIGGTVLGMVAGLAATKGRLGRFVDTILMRLLDVLLAFPVLVLVAAVASIALSRRSQFGPIHLSQTWLMTVVIGIVIIPIFGRLSRAGVMSEVELDYVLASRASGTSAWRTVFHVLLPNVRTPLIVQAAFVTSGAVMAEASLSFLGLGIQPPQASWGNILLDGQQQLLYGGWWLIAFPSIAIALTALSSLLIGEGLRDVLDPKSAVDVIPAGIVAEKERPTVDVSAGAAGRPAAESRLLSVEDVSISYWKDGRKLDAVRHASLHVERGEIVGIVGESGSGKSTLLRAVASLLSSNGRVSDGQLLFQGMDLTRASERDLAGIRGSGIGMVFQDPVSSFNPAMTIGRQVQRVIALHRDDVAKQDRRQEAIRILDRVGIEGSRAVDRYPFEFSQGQLQRIMIAAVCLGARPALLLADEPTASLDATIEAQVVDLLRELQRELNLGILIVSHDLALVSQLCDRVSVMYAGRVIEEAAATSAGLPLHHPYSEALRAAIPAFPSTGQRLVTVPGEIPDLANPGIGCRFAGRCAQSLGSHCDTHEPLPWPQGPSGAWVACHRFDPGFDPEHQSENTVHLVGRRES